MKVVLFLSFFIYSQILTGQNGLLDITFGDSGKVVTNLGFRRNWAKAMALQPDGKIIVGGEADYEFGLARYLPNGSLDESFGTAGIVFSDVDNSIDRLNSIALQADGKIISFGYGGSDIFDFVLMRHHSDGTLDTSFGEGGIVITDIDNTTDYPGQVIVLPDGKILVAGGADYYRPGQRVDSDFAVLRYLNNGVVDSTFGTNGRVLTDIDNYSVESVKAIELQPDGKFLVAGYTDNNNGEDDNFGMVRYNPDGTIDGSFGINGRVTTDFEGVFELCNDIALQPDGKIVLVGYSGTSVKFAVARYDQDGNLDEGFGEGGKVLLRFGSWYNTAEVVVIDENGNLIIGGSALSGNYYNSALAMLKPDGSLNESFGNGGMLITDFGTQSGITDILLQPDRKLLTCGFDFNLLFDSIENKNDTVLFALARYLMEPIVSNPQIVSNDCLFTLYPNPTDGSLTIETTIKSNYRIFDVNGKLMKEDRLEKGRNTIQVDVDAGLYFIQVIDDYGKRVGKRFVKL